MPTLPTRKLGDLEASAIGLGCMSLVPGGSLYDTEGLTEEEAISVLRRALDSGITLFNTSDLYGPYRGEETLGKALEGRRDGVAIATKWGPMIDKEGNFKADFSAANARACAEGSLQRLRTDRLDLYTLRGPLGPDVQLEDTMRELKKLVEEGKVRHLGMSEVTAEQVRRAHAIHPIAAVELEWSLFSREVERELIPTMRELGIGALAYSPLGRGFLAGRFTSRDEIGGKDFRSRTPRFQGEAFEANLRLAGRVRELAARKGCTAAQLALAWLLAQGDDVIPIPGTKSAARLEENVGALDIKLTPEELREIEAAVPESEVVGSRY